MSAASRVQRELAAALGSLVAAAPVEKKKSLAKAIRNWQEADERQNPPADLLMAEIEDAVMDELMETAADRGDFDEEGDPS